MRLWGEIATPQRLTHLLFRSFHSLPRQEMDQVREVKKKKRAQGPVLFNILPVFYNVNLDCLIHPLGAPGT